MNREDIIRMARENEWVADVHHGKWDEFFVWFFNRAAATERARIIPLLKGIDMCETDSDDGWWETNEGAAIGARILAQIKGQA